MTANQRETESIDVENAADALEENDLVLIEYEGDFRGRTHEVEAVVQPNNYTHRSTPEDVVDLLVDKRDEDGTYRARVTDSGRLKGLHHATKRHDHHKGTVTSITRVPTEDPEEDEEDVDLRDPSLYPYNHCPECRDSPLMQPIEGDAKIKCVRCSHEVKAEEYDELMATEEDAEERGVEVYQSTRTSPSEAEGRHKAERDLRHRVNFEDDKPTFAEFVRYYDFVGEDTAASVDDVWHKWNHGSGRESEAFREANTRSMEVGDVVRETDTGRAFVCKSIGWERVEALDDMSNEERIRLLGKDLKEHFESNVSLHMSEDEMEEDTWSLRITTSGRYLPPEWMATLGDRDVGVEYLGETEDGAAHEDHTWLLSLPGNHPLVMRDIYGPHHA